MDQVKIGKFIAHCRKQQNLTQSQLAEKLDITSRAVKKNIKELVEKGLVEREGSARKGYWKIKE